MFSGTDIPTSSKPDTVPTNNSDVQRLRQELQQEREKCKQQEQLTQQLTVPLIQENEKEVNRRMALERELGEERGEMKLLRQQNERERNERQGTEHQLRVMQEYLSRSQQENHRLKEELEQIHQEMEGERNVARTRARDQEQERNRRMALETELRETKKTLRQQEEQRGEIQLLKLDCLCKSGLVKSGSKIKSPDYYHFVLGESNKTTILFILTPFSRKLVLADAALCMTSKQFDFAPF